jgi:hypothetical protein
MKPAKRHRRMKRDEQRRRVRRNNGEVAEQGWVKWHGLTNPGRFS